MGRPRLSRGSTENVQLVPHNWALRRINNTRPSVEYLGACVGASIRLESVPTNGAFNGFVVGFRATAGVGGDLRVEGKKENIKVLPDLLVLVSSVPERDDVAALAASDVTMQIAEFLCISVHI